MMRSVGRDAGTSRLRILPTARFEILLNQLRQHRLFIQQRAHRRQFFGVRMRDPRGGQWELRRSVTHPAVPPDDEVGRLDNVNVHHRCQNTITGCGYSLMASHRPVQSFRTDTS
jgi:hypothetical protein